MMIFFMFNDSKAYINDLLKKTNAIRKIEILPELPATPIPNIKQTLLPVVNTQNKFFRLIPNRTNTH